MSMNDLTKALALTLAFGLGTAAMAQESTEAPAADSEAGTATEAPAADENLNMGAAAPEAGAPAQAADGVGSIYVEAKHGDWEQRCIRQEDGSDPCQLYQLLKDGQGNSVAEISMFPLPSGQKAVAGATLIAPLETLLTENIVIAVDTAKGRVYPFNWCDQGGCVARIGFTAEEVAAFKAGSKATLTIVPAAAPTQKVQLDISLKGFTAGFDAVSATAGN